MKKKISTTITMPKDFGLSRMPQYANLKPIDLDTDTLLREAKAMHKEVIASKNGTGPFIAFQKYYENKYPYLFERCPRWFDTIFKGEMENHMNVLENMVNKVQSVQDGSKSQYQADVEVGQALYDRYCSPKVDSEKEKEGGASSSRQERRRKERAEAKKEWKGGI